MPRFPMRFWPVVAALAAWCSLGCGRFRPEQEGEEPGPAPTAGALPEQVKNPKDGSVELLVPAGEFLLGEGERQKQVTLDAFYIDRTEVTNAQYAKFLAAVQQDGDAQWRHPAQPASKKDHVPLHWENKNLGKARGDHPVVGVDWFDAYAYARWAGKRLPSQFEWERAARGADGRVYPWGNDPPSEGLTFRANFFPTFLAADQYQYTAPVGSFPEGASPAGCLNMAGNVAEWCADWYGPLPAERRLDQPTGPESGSYRVIKGGAWNTAAPSLRTFSRWRAAPAKATASVGFRCARDAAPEAATR